jgi:hypothetical protein
MTAGSIARGHDEIVAARGLLARAGVLSRLLA